MTWAIGLVFGGLLGTLLVLVTRRAVHRYLDHVLEGAAWGAVGFAVPVALSLLGAWGAVRSSTPSAAEKGGSTFDVWILFLSIPILWIAVDADT